MRVMECKDGSASHVKVDFTEFYHEGMGGGLILIFKLQHEK